MSIVKEDYIGFTYNNVHSSELGILRVSDGSRFNENLLPTMQDKTVEVPGGDGSYYFGSYYSQRQIDVSFAFDGITEQQLEFMKELFGDKKVHPLVFDETPYKTYQAKVTGTNTIKYIPFSGGETNRIYKGEGTIQFTCYFPYAICERKFLSHGYDLEQAVEWNDAAKLRERYLQDIDDETVNDTRRIKLYNPGVKESDWILLLRFEEDGTMPALGLKTNDFQLNTQKIIAKEFSNNGVTDYDSYLCFNSRNGLIEGVRTFRRDEYLNHTYEKTGNIYNEYITNGEFFKIPLTFKKTPHGHEELDVWFEIAHPQSEMPGYICLDYNYYYF